MVLMEKLINLKKVGQTQLIVFALFLYIID